MIELKGDTLTFWVESKIENQKDLNALLVHKRSILDLKDDIISELICDSPYINDPTEYRAAIEVDIKEIEALLVLFTARVEVTTIDVVSG